MKAVDLALKSAELPPLEWYDVLLELERHRRPMRARELERGLLIAQYNLSRLLDRLEQARLVSRHADPADGRSRMIIITDEGLALRRRMWPVYKQVIETEIGKRLVDGQANGLAELLMPIAASGPAGCRRRPR